MNKAKLKSYAPQARLDFIAAVTARANLLGLSEKAGQLEVAPVQTQGDVALIAGQAWPAKVATQREQLVIRMRREGFAQTCEAIAYTWFNRFAALRYMELHDYLDHGHRALSSAEGGLPDILTYASDLAHTGDTGLPGLKAELVTEMKLAGNRDSELYRMLLVAQCNALSKVMPFLFERIDDDSELLLPDNLLRSDSVIAKLVEEIPEEDWAEVEIIGWLYQFYISDKKDQVIGKVVKSEDIPAATQLFTPNWIVQYLVQNSVGRLWLMANPQSTLAKDWPYYITPAEQAPEVRGQLDALIQARVREDGDALNPESITVLDPACGSGHILVVAYDTLKAIYLERGYQPRSIPRLILEKNLFGLDIDDRAAQMAGFALLMKARADDRRLFSDPVNLNILSLQESEGLDSNALAQTLQVIADRCDLKSEIGIIGSEFGVLDLFPESHLQSSLGEPSSNSRANNEFEDTLALLISTFSEAKTFGSLITVSKQLSIKLAWLNEILNLAHQQGDLYVKLAAQDLMPLVSQAKILSIQFDAVVANPPYMGNKYLAPKLKVFLKDNFIGFEKDLFSAFMIRNLSLAKPSGQLGLMSPFVWMFISSYEGLRSYFLENATLSSLVQLEYSGFDGATVPICTFTLGKANVAGFNSSFVRLTDFKGSENQGPKTLEAIQDHSRSWFFTAKPDDFRKVPGAPIAYWLTKKIISLFEKCPSFGSRFDSKQGLATADNGRFMRLWHEVPIDGIALGLSNSAEARTSKKRWFPCNKGGAFRKWYGNHEFIVNWEDDGKEIKEYVTKQYPYLKGNIDYVIKDRGRFFNESLSWSDITSSDTAFRYYPNGFIYDATGHSAFWQSKNDFYVGLAFLNTNIVNGLIKALNPTLHFHIGYFDQLPFPVKFDVNKVKASVERAIEISKEDWDERETSWNFQSMIGKENFKGSGLADFWRMKSSKSISQVQELRTIEESNNQLFIEAFDLQDELLPDVADGKIALFRADREKDCQRLISYAIGCMMGRYSLDEPGLIYAHTGNIGFNTGRYTIFSADDDGILPITDDLWFDDDASGRIREFLQAVWGVDTLEENIAWLAESLGSKPNETTDETIRHYISDKFYKDHLQAYKKRPIYWLFNSGKQGAFKALVYLHRYNEGTLARMRAEYVVPLANKIQSRIEILQKDADAAGSTAARNKLAKNVESLKKKRVELLLYDEQLRHYADMRINLDLDDGIKVNYGKFGDLLAEVKAVAGRASDE